MAAETTPSGLEHRVRLENTEMRTGCGAASSDWVLGGARDLISATHVVRRRAGQRRARARVTWVLKLKTVVVWAPWRSISGMAAASQRRTLVFGDDGVEELLDWRRSERNQRRLWVRWIDSWLEIGSATGFVFWFEALHGGERVVIVGFDWD
ncbi:hypothetical protein M0R45_025811 [Rubus argutus]|uniref:Uncharacterized protein n=1 Tax=Rubus argutus TaxID=59490 RepID=A0AAW1WVP3_RUBAR